MSKKDFKGGLDSLIGEKPEKEELVVTTQAKGTPKEIRATFIVNEEAHEKLKAIAYFERETIKNVLDNILGEGIKNYEKRNGKDYLELYKKSKD